MKSRLAVVLALLLIAGIVYWRLKSTEGRLGGSHEAGSQVSSVGPLSTGSAIDSGSSPGGGGWSLTFDGEFSGHRLNTAVWGTCYPWQSSGTGCRNFGDNEFEWYVPSQVQVSNGVLRLVAQRKKVFGRSGSGTPQTYACRSGMVTTFPGYRFQYGYVQVVARIPQGTGLWPALWLAASNMHWPPEIDILEHWGRVADHTGVFLHPVGSVRVGTRHNSIHLSAGWHVYSLLWTSSRLVWYIDGHEVFAVARHIPSQPMYFVANLAEYILPSGPGGCDGSLLIKSVKVWRR